MNIFQSKEWESLKLKTGYQQSYWVEGILVLQKNLPLGYSMLYSPMVDREAINRIQQSGFRSKFIENIKEIGANNRTIFYRFELNIDPKELNSEFLNSFIKSFEEMQPEHSLVLNLTQSEDDLLAQMKQKGRYNIKIASKNEIYVKSALEEVDNFYSLYAQTGKRHHISYRGKRYFETLVEILGEKGYANVYTAYTKQGGQEIPLSSAIMVYSNDTAIYMFGASSDEHKNLMAPYLLHWTMIREAKERGFKSYDFFGIAPENEPNHPWAGVTRFKKQFGGEESQLLGSYDLVIKPLEYQLFKIAEKIRR